MARPERSSLTPLASDTPRPRRMFSVFMTGSLTRLATLLTPAFLLVILALVPGAVAALPPVPVPPENPITEAKRALGKILFFDEQVSMSSTVSCGTCHISSRGGNDNRLSRVAGPDNVLNTPDDILGSAGTIRSTALNEYVRDVVFGLRPQVTTRAANSNINAVYAQNLFWDGRATSNFVDPQTGQTVIPTGGALESQAVGPPTNSVEMGHDNIDWSFVVAKLKRSRPLDLATTIPADLTTTLADRPTYPELFRRTFGDGAITARRIAFAIATYQRSLISDQTPWDRFQAGQNNALSAGQIRGMNAFNSNQQRCNACHVPPLFSDNTFRAIGTRPPTEDTGRQAISNAPNNADIGKFKVPSLRNVGLKQTFFHRGATRTSGVTANLGDAVRFYDRVPPNPPLPQFTQNQDPIIPTIVLPPNVATDIIDFLQNGLTDPRVAAETFPFDHPTLFVDRAQHRATLVTPGTAGTGGVVPSIVVQAPSMVGNTDYRVGLDGALGGSTARLGMSTLPPTNGRITPDRFLGEVTAAGVGTGLGLATLQWPLTPGTVAGGQTVYLQWFVDDAAAPGGEARSAVASVPVFCGSSGCPPTCAGDFNADGTRSSADIFAFLTTYFSGSLNADTDRNDALSPTDIFAFLNVYFAGC